MYNPKSWFYPLLTGILLSLTLPYIGLWPLVWVALVPYMLFAASPRVGIARNIAGALLMGIPYAIAVTAPLMNITGWWWSTSEFSPYAAQLQFAAAVFLVGCWGALFFVPIGLLMKHAGRHPLAPLFIAVAWVAIEWLRSGFALFGYSWGVLGYTLIDTIYVKHVAGIFGVYGLSLLIVGINAALARMIAIRASGGAGGLLDHIRKDFPKYSGVVAVLALFAIVVGYGIYKELPPRCDDKTPVTFAVIGSMLSTEESVSEGTYRLYRQKLLQTLSFRTGVPDIIVFPENVFPFFELDEEDGTPISNPIVPLANRDALYADLMTISRENPETIFAIGLHTRKEGRRYNSIAFYREGTTIGYYRKRKLVPFTEYAPFHLSLPIVVSFARGEARQYLDLNGMRTTGLMCSEAGDTHMDIDEASLIIAPSNDSVFGGEAVALIHHSMARMRALESSAYLLRASKGGISSIIAPDGTVVREGRGEVLVAQVEMCGE